MGNNSYVISEEYVEPEGPGTPTIWLAIGSFRRIEDAMKFKSDKELENPEKTYTFAQVQI